MAREQKERADQEEKQAEQRRADLEKLDNEQKERAKENPDEPAEDRTKRESEECKQREQEIQEREERENARLGREQQELAELLEIHEELSEAERKELAKNQNERASANEHESTEDRVTREKAEKDQLEQDLRAFKESEIRQLKQEQQKRAELEEKASESADSESAEGSNGDSDGDSDASSIRGEGTRGDAEAVSEVGNDEQKATPSRTSDAGEPVMQMAGPERSSPKEDTGSTLERLKEDEAEIKGDGSDSPRPPSRPVPKETQSTTGGKGVFGEPTGGVFGKPSGGVFGHPKPGVFESTLPTYKPGFGYLNKKHADFKAWLASNKTETKPLPDESRVGTSAGETDGTNNLQPRVSGKADGSADGGSDQTVLPDNNSKKTESAQKTEPSTDITKTPDEQRRRQAREDKTASKTGGRSEKTTGSGTRVVERGGLREGNEISSGILQESGFEQSSAIVEKSFIREVDASDKDPRIVNIFGDDWKFKWTKLGFPKPPKYKLNNELTIVVRDGTKTLSTAELSKESKAVKCGLLREGTYSREELHEAIRNYFLSGGNGQERAIGSLTATQPPEIMLMGGGGGAGKSSLLKRLEREGHFSPENRVLINADEIREFLPEYDKLIGIGQGDYRAAQATHEESSDLAKQIYAEALQRKYNITFDGTFKDGEKGLALISDARAQGYEVRMLAVTIDPHEAMVRARIRAHEKKRYVPDEVLLAAHKGFNAALPDYAKALGKNITIYENSGREPIEIPKEDLLDGRFDAAEKRARLTPDADSLDELLSSYGASKEVVPAVSERSAPVPPEKSVEIEQKKELPSGREYRELPEKIDETNYPESLDEAKALLDRARVDLEKNGGRASYRSPHTDKELLDRAASSNNPADWDRYMVTLQPEGRDDISRSIGATNGKYHRAYVSGLRDIYRADSDPKLIGELQGMEYDPNIKWRVVIIDRYKDGKPDANYEYLPPTHKNLQEFSKQYNMGEVDTEDLSPEQRTKLRDHSLTAEGSAAYKSAMNKFDAWAEQKRKDAPDEKTRKEINEFSIGTMDKFLSEKQSEMTEEEHNQFKLRHSVRKEMGANRDLTGDGTTMIVKDQAQTQALRGAEGNTRGSVEYIQLSPTQLSLKELEKAGRAKLMTATPLEKKND